MKAETLDNLMTISAEGPSVESYMTLTKLSFYGEEKRKGEFSRKLLDPID